MAQGFEKETQIVVEHAVADEERRPFQKTKLKVSGTGLNSPGAVIRSTKSI